MASDRSSSGSPSRGPAGSQSLPHRVVELLSAEPRALHVAEIATRLGVRDRARLSEVLDDLTFDGVVLARSGRRYRLAPGARRQQEERIEGTLSVNPRGFGFVRATGAADDVYVPAEALGGAMHGDRVVVRVVARTRRGREGEIVEVVGRARTLVVGILRGRPGQRRWLEPDDSRVRGPIEIVEEAVRDAKAGLAAAVTLVRYPEHADENPQGRLDRVLGPPGEPDVEVLKVLLEHAIDETHPADAEAQAAALGEDPSPEDLAGREDLTAIPFLAIDPKDARDHDDAIWVERDEHGRYQAYIAIADVSHYVTENSPLDRSAEARGCSVYLPDRAVPMLPPTLSGKLCSLLPERERLCLCVHVALDATGKPHKTRVIEGRMRARAFLTYDVVARALGFTTEPARDPAAEQRRHELGVMWDLAMLLRKRRMRRGALDLDVPEAEVQIDDVTRAPISVSQRSMDPGVKKAYRLIEELMLLANEAVAQLAIERELPVIYRVHGPPDPEKLERYAAQCAALGVTFDVDDAADPKRLGKFLRTIDAHPRKAILHVLMLRALKQAAYDPVNIGHYGLASSAYLHFTSPIRRYPDLWVHRMVRKLLRGERIPKGEALEQALRDAALTASERERNAMEAEREVADVYRALYMRSRIGDTLEGMVTAITPTGVYLRVEEPFLDVLVRLDALSPEGAGLDAYEPDDLGLTVTAARSGETIRLGDRMLVVVEDVSIERRTVFGKRLATEAPRRKRAAAKPRKQRRDTGGRRVKGRGRSRRG